MTVNSDVDDEEESVTTEFSAVEPDATFDNVQDNQVQVVKDSAATVSGSTNVAPNSEITVELRKTGENPFLETQSVEVTNDGTFSAAFDTSAIPVNTEFTAVVQDFSDDVNAVIVGSLGTPTPPTAPPEDTPTDEPTETTTEGQPGFGVAIAVVALLAAALLAIRRD